MKKKKRRRKIEEKKRTKKNKKRHRPKSHGRQIVEPPRHHMSHHRYVCVKISKRMLSNVGIMGERKLGERERARRMASEVGFDAGPTPFLLLQERQVP